MLQTKSKYYYKNNVFNTSWELAYWIYCEDNNINIEHVNKRIEHQKLSADIPFSIDNNLIDIYRKGLLSDVFDLYRHHNVKIVREKEIKSILTYIYHKYGKEYLNKFKNKNKSDFKRKIIETDNLTLDELSKYKNKNVRFHYICKQCNKDVYTTWHLLEHFNDNLCKYCRTHKEK